MAYNALEEIMDPAGKDINTFEAVHGSYRDPSGQVFLRDDRVFRSVTKYGLENFKAVEKTGLLTDLVDKGLLVPWWDADKNELCQEEDGVLRVLEHTPLPFISYPFEWSFSALKSAALLHLDIHQMALAKGVTLSDASAFNVQFNGSKPIFIDHLSFRPYLEGEFWKGHGQFCEQFLNPLLLQSQIGIPHNAWYRGTPEGIPSASLASLLPFRSRLKLQVLTNVILPVWFERRSSSSSEVSKSVSKKRLPLSGFQNMLAGLRKFIDSLKPPNQATVWKEYAENNSYATDEAKTKSRFINEFCSNVKPNIIWDMGCNTGEYSQAALDGGAQMAVGFEYDIGALERAYARALNEKLNFLPLHLDAANPTPSQGWNQQERGGLAERRNADAVMALALVHHLAIGRNIPLPSVVQWLIDHAPQGVIEFVPKKDPMVQELLSLRDDIFDNYTDEIFDQAIASRAHVVREETITNTGRRLVWFKRR